MPGWVNSKQINKEDTMSVKTKKGIKNTSKFFGIALFALLMFTNIKIATMNNNELAKGDISLFGITVTLFDGTDAYGGGGGAGGCYTFGHGETTYCTLDCWPFDCSGSETSCYLGNCICYAWQCH